MNLVAPKNVFKSLPCWNLFRISVYCLDFSCLCQAAREAGNLQKQVEELTEQLHEEKRLRVIMFP